jgi:hypothetical protein
MNANEILSIVLTGTVAQLTTETEALDVDMGNKMKAIRQLGKIDGLSNHHELVIALNAIERVARFTSTGTGLVVRVVPEDVAVVWLDLARFGLI